MRRVEQEATRMGALVDDLLRLARLDQGSTPDARPVDLTAVVEDAARDLRAVEPARPVIVAADPVRVVGDDGALRQAVGNLLANARVHTPPAAPVRVTLRAQDGWAVVEVADEGPGMPAEVAARVFERFYRADPARARASGGAGLGLSIFAGIAAAHGGQITVDTAPGRGARFRLRLPLTAPATPAGDGASGLPDDSQRAPTKLPAASALPHRRVRDSGEPCPSET